MPQCHHSFKLRRLESTDGYEIPVHLLASEKLSGGFLSCVPSSPHFLPLHHPQIASGIPSCCSAGVPGKSEGKAELFSFFSFFCCATFLNAAFSIRQRLISAFLFMQQKEVPGQPAGPSSHRCSTLLRTPPAIVIQRLFHKAGVVRLPLLSRALHPRVEKLVPDTRCFHGRLWCNMLQIYSLSVNFVVFLLLFY